MDSHCADVTFTNAETKKECTITFYVDNGCAGISVYRDRSEENCGDTLLHVEDWKLHDRFNTIRNESLDLTVMAGELLTLNANDEKIYSYVSGEKRGSYVFHYYGDKEITIFRTEHMVYNARIESVAIPKDSIKGNEALFFFNDGTKQTGSLAKLNTF